MEPNHNTSEEIQLFTQEFQPTGSLTQVHLHPFNNEFQLQDIQSMGDDTNNNFPFMLHGETNNHNLAQQDFSMIDNILMNGLHDTHHQQQTFFNPFHNQQNTSYQFQFNQIQQPTVEVSSEEKQILQKEMENQEKKKRLIKEAEDYLLTKSDQAKKYGKAVICPTCLIANLKSFEINKADSLLMCPNQQCSFPLKEDDVMDYQYPTKFKKRCIAKIKGRILRTFNPHKPVVFDESDLQRALEHLEPTQKK